MGIALISGRADQDQGMLVFIQNIDVILDSCHGGSRKIQFGAIIQWEIPQSGIIQGLELKIGSRDLPAWIVFKGDFFLAADQVTLTNLHGFDFWNGIFLSLEKKDHADGLSLPAWISSGKPASTRLTSKVKAYPNEVLGSSSFVISRRLMSLP